MKRCMTVLLILILGLTAMGYPAMAETFRPMLAANTAATVVVAGNYGNFEALEAVFDDFNALYPNVKLRYEKLDDYNQIGSLLDGDNAPNIYFTFPWMVGNDLYAPCFDHAENLAERALGFKVGGIRSSLLSYDERGRLLMVPVLVTTYGMLINEDLFVKEGLRVPATYTELTQVCAALKQKGYPSPMMGYIGNAANSLANALVYPSFCGALAGDPGKVEKAKALDAAAGEYMRPGLERLRELVDRGFINLNECKKIADNYTQTILRFFEGDVPMMICGGDTVSGTKKRESQSAAFTAHPFAYRFATVPLTDQGAWAVYSPAIQFSVNKKCRDLDMTNEFMRFLLSASELNKLAKVKRLVTSGTDLTHDNVYAALANVPSDKIITPEAEGVTDDISKQVRMAAGQMLTDGLTVDETVALFGTYR